MTEIQKSRADVYRANGFKQVDAPEEFERIRSCIFMKRNHDDILIGILPNGDRILKTDGKSGEKLGELIELITSLGQSPGKPMG